jgi:hypothetical protein
MESYTPEWPNKRNIVEAIRLARVVVVDANEVRQTSSAAAEPPRCARKPNVCAQHPRRANSRGES